MLFVFRSLLSVEAFCLWVYGLWLCRIFIGGLFSESQYVPCQVFSLTKPAWHSSRTDLTRPSSPGTVRVARHYWYLNNNKKPFQHDTWAVQSTHQPFAHIKQICTNYTHMHTCPPGLPSHIWIRYRSPFRILAWCSGEHQAKLLTLTN